MRLVSKLRLALAGGPCGGFFKGLRPLIPKKIKTSLSILDNRLRNS